jgi:hypothetical protein
MDTREKVHKIKKKTISRRNNEIEQPNSRSEKVKVKVKQSRYRPGQAQRVGRGIVLIFRDLGA